MSELVMEEIWLPVLALLGSILGSFLLIVLAALIGRSSPIRLRHWAEEAGPELRRLYASRRRFEAFCILLCVLARIAPLAVFWVLWRLLEGLGLDAPAGLAAVLLAAGLLLVEGTSHLLVGRYAEVTLRRLSGLFRGAHFLLRPAVWLLSRLLREGEPEEDEEEDSVSEQELAAYIDVGRREGILEPEEEKLVRSIVDFGDARVRSVMTPRVEMVSAPVEARLEDLAELFLASKHARLPLYRDSIDHVVGILHIRDLFAALRSDHPPSAADLTHPPLHVPESKGLHQLLGEMQKLHQQMAIVVDEYGGVAGLVTVEDLVEEIVGDISDEHEPRSSDRIRLDDGRWRLRGRVEVDELEELFQVDCGETPYETVSGLICGELGYVPRIGEVIRAHGLEMEIEEADERKVTAVVVGPAPREGA